jgi:hypothetical protein
VLDVGQPGHRLDPRPFVVGFRRQLEQRLRVVQPALRFLPRGQRLLEQRLLFQQSLRLDVIVPEVGQRRVAFDQRDAALLAIEVKDSP